MLAFSLPLLVDRRGSAAFSGIIVKLMKNRTASLPHATVLDHMRHLGAPAVGLQWEGIASCLFFFQNHKLIISFPAPCTFKSWKRQLFALHPQEPLSLWAWSVWCLAGTDLSWAPVSALVLAEPVMGPYLHSRAVVLNSVDLFPRAAITRNHKLSA